MAARRPQLLSALTQQRQQGARRAAATAPRHLGRRVAASPVGAARPYGDNKAPPRRGGRDGRAQGHEGRFPHQTARANRAAGQPGSLGQAPPPLQHPVAGQISGYPQPVANHYSGGRRSSHRNSRVQRKQAEGRGRST